MEPTARVAPRAKPGTPRTPSARAAGEAAPDLLRAALMCARDECPPETAMQLCGMAEDYWDGCCLECWTNYLYWVRNDRRGDPYRSERGREIG